MAKQKNGTYCECGDPYTGIPVEIDCSCSDYVQPWSGYVPKRVDSKPFLVQEANIKREDIYRDIEVGFNEWMQMACDEALISVKAGGGPFGAVIVQVDDETNEVLRYWKAHNMVTEWCDPTAHAEVNAIRVACHDLGVFDLGAIKKKESLLSQMGKTSHCEMYSSTEPCPMCYSAVCWARIPALIFAATRFDAAEPGVEFSDLELYQQLEIPYDQRSMTVRQSSCPNSLDAFNLWKYSDVIRY